MTRGGESMGISCQVILLDNGAEGSGEGDGAGLADWTCIPDRSCVMQLFLAWASLRTGEGRSSL